MIPLVAVAHGSRDPRSAATVRSLVERARVLAPELEIRVAFLDLSDPPVGEVLAELHAQGHREIVVAPLLLGSAYHARVDLPALVAEVTARLPRLTVHISGVLGIAPELEAVALDRVRETGVDLANPALGVVLAAVGSSNVAANNAVAALAERWHTRRGLLVAPAFASATKPDVPAALAKLRGHGATQFVVASWFLAPGLLPDRIAGFGVPMAAPLGTDSRVAALALRRYEEMARNQARSA